MFINDIFKKQLNENLLDEISRRDFLKGAGAAAVTGAVGYGAGQLNKDRSINPYTVNSLSDKDIEAIDTFLTWYVLVQKLGKPSIFGGKTYDSQLETNTVKQLIQVYGKDFVFSRLKKIKERILSLSDEQVQIEFEKFWNSKNDSSMQSYIHNKLLPDSNLNEHNTKEFYEAGPFSYGAKKPRKGSVADLAAQKRKEQDRKTPAIEPKDQQVGVARVVKEYGDTPKGQKQLTRVHKRAVDRLIKADDKNMLEPDYTKRDLKTVRKNQATADRAWDRMADLEEQGVAEGSGVTKLNDYDTWLDRVDALGAEKHVQKNRTLIVAQSWDGEKVGEFDTSSNQGWVMTQGVAEGFDDLDRFMKDKYGPQPRGGSGIKTGTYGSPRRKRGRPTGAESLSGGSDIPHAVDFDRPHSERSAGRKLPRFSDDYDAIKRSEVDEGSAQDKLYKRHQELRKKSGLPDPDYYKELKASYDLPDQDRYAKQKEIKQKYKVTNEDREQYIEELGRAGYEIVTEKRMTCPECGGAAYEDKMLAEKQDACYHKVKSRYKVWPSAYASGALVRCRKKGAKNWGNKRK